MKNSIQGLETEAKKLMKNGGWSSAKSLREKFLPMAIKTLMAADTAGEVLQIFKIINNKTKFMHVAGSFKGINTDNYKHIAQGSKIERHYGATTSIMHLIGEFCAQKLEYIHQEKPKDISALTVAFGELRIKLEKDYNTINSEEILESWKKWNLKSAGEEKFEKFLPHPPLASRPFLGKDDWEMVEPIDEQLNRKIELSKTLLLEIKMSGKSKDKVKVVKNLEKTVIDYINSYFLGYKGITDLASAIKIFSNTDKYKELIDVCKNIQRLFDSIQDKSLGEVQDEAEKIEKTWNEVSDWLILKLLTPEETQSEQSEQSESKTSQSSSAGRLPITRSLSFSSGVSPYAFLPQVKKKNIPENSSQKNRSFSFED